MSLNPIRSARFHNFVIDRPGCVVLWREQTVPLNKKTFDLLLYLIDHRDRLVTKDELLENLWPKQFVEERNLTQHVFLLRKAFSTFEADQEIIQTVPRRGFRFTAPVEEIDTNPKQVILSATASVPEVEVDHATPAHLGPALPTSEGEQAAPGMSSLRHPLADTPSIPPSTSNQQTTRNWTSLQRSPLVWLLTVLVILVGVFVTAMLLRRPDHRTANVHYVQLTRDGMDKRGAAHTHGGPPAALVTDGARVYFTEGTSGGTRLAEVAVTGGETATIPVPFKMTQLLDYSAARSELLVGGFSSQQVSQRLWGVPLPSGVPHQIGEIEATDAAWSPDGSEIAFTRDTVLYRSSADGSHVSQIATLPSNPYRPRWSPDGRLIRFTMLDRRTKEQSLWEVGVDGSNLRPVLPGWNPSSPQCCGDWSKDGSRFVFQATHEGTTEIWSLPRANGLIRLFGLNSPQQITLAPQDLLTPTVSPDGATLYALGQQLRGELVRYDEKEHQFLPYLGGKSFDYLEFSLDGKWITYVAYPEGTLWRSRADGSDRLQLTFAPMRVMRPHWSPDGREIVFHGLANGSNRDYTVSTMGGVPKAVLDDEVMSLDWSPDGTSFVYSDFPFFTIKPEDTGVHIYNIRNKQVTDLPASKGLVSPVWSPDGRYIAATRATGDRLTLLFDTQTQSWSTLVGIRGIPRWSHDSRWLFYLPADNDQAMMKIRISDHQTEKVTDLSQIRITGGLAGVQFSLSPEDSPILLKDTGTQEIYSVVLSPH